MYDVKNFSPEYLFHIGAFTDLEFCEKNPDETYITNTLSVKNATNIANADDDAPMPGLIIIPSKTGNILKQRIHVMAPIIPPIKYVEINCLLDR